MATKLTFGTVAVTNGSAVVTLTGGDWTGLVASGDSFQRIGDGVTYKVKTLDSGTQLTLASNYAGTTGSGASYEIVYILEKIPDGEIERRTGGGPKGDTGLTGETGAAATIAVNPSPVTKAPGTSVEVANTGDSSAAVFLFSIPRGAAWYAGVGVPSGATGLDGDYYIDQTPASMKVHGPKASGSWPAGIEITGDQGVPGESGLILDPVIKTASFTAAIGYTHLADTTGGAFNMTFPLSPSIGDKVGVLDVGFYFGGNPLTLLPNGSNVGGVAYDTVINASRISCVFRYASVAAGWVLEECVIAGITGPAGTLAVGTVATGSPGTSVIITNVGTDTAAILNITIPRGDVGATGPSGAGLSLIQAVKTAAFTAVAGGLYPCDTSGGAFSATLPASPSVDDVCEFHDWAGNWDTDNLTILGNGEKIGGTLADMIVDIRYINPTLRYTGSTYGWMLKGTY